MGNSPQESHVLEQLQSVDFDLVMKGMRSFSESYKIFMLDI